MEEIITLKFNPKNTLIKSIINSAILAGAKVEEKEPYPYDPEFVKKIQKSRNSKGKSIKTEDLWK
ncbi:MAG: DUF2683 family protein [Verrucomicrobiota bacterium]